MSCCAFIVLALPIAGVAEPAIEGTWINGDGDGWIELRIAKGELRGTIIGSAADPDNRSPSRTDERNPDPALRDRPLRGLMILYGFRQDTDGRWTGGRVYDPNSGNTYRGTITVLDSHTLKLRGYIGISWFGRSETWRRRVDSD